jgi:hypothetical protein
MSDAGTADPRLAAALAAFDGSPASRAELLAAAAGARVFVPIIATATGQHTQDHSGLRAESGAEMALVSLVASDGARAVPAFPDVAALERWRPDVRPVPVGVPYLCQAALDDGAEAVLLDPLGAGVVLSGGELTDLSAGYVPVPGAAVSFRRTTQRLEAPATPPDRSLVEALAAALAPERLVAAQLLEGPSGRVVGVVPPHPLAPAELAALASRVAARLGESLPAGGIDLAVVPPDGPGAPIPQRGR